MAHHHHGASYSQPSFVAELEAPSAGPPLASIVNGTPIFEMPGESAVLEDESEHKRHLQHRLPTPEVPAQANPWPFYLEDASQSHQSRMDVKDDKPGGGQAQGREAVPAQANPWPYHGPPGDDDSDDIKANAAQDEKALPSGSDAQSRPHAGRTAGSETEQKPFSTARHPSPDHGHAASRSTSPTQLIPAPLRISRSSRPPSQSDISAPTPTDQKPPTPAVKTVPPPSSGQLTDEPVTLPYRPYRPHSPPRPAQSSAASVPNTTITTTHDSPDAAPSTPYPPDSPPRHVSMPQGPAIPQSPPLPVGSATRRSTQPAPVAAGPPPLYPDAHPHRHNSLSTPSFVPPPQSPVAHQTLVSPLASPISPSYRPSASPVASQQITYGPPQPGHHPQPSPGAGYGLPPSLHTAYAHAAHGGPNASHISSPPLTQPPHSPGVGGPYTSTYAMVQGGEPPQSGLLQPSPQTDYVQYQSRPNSSSSQHQQAVGTHPTQPQAQQLNVEYRPPPQFYPQHQQHVLLSPTPTLPPIQPPRPQIHHVSTDPLSPSYLHPQSPPPPYTHDVHRTNSQPIPSAHVPPIYPPPHSSHSPNAYSPVPQSPYYGQTPLGSPQGYYPQQQYSPSYQVPPLPPRPVSANPPFAATGFGPGIPSVASFPPPPKTQYVPSPQNAQRPSAMKLFSGSSAKKWLDKTNHVLESKLAPMLQAQTDMRVRTVSGQGQGQAQQVFQQTHSGQHYYPYGIRGESSTTTQYGSHRGGAGER